MNIVRMNKLMRDRAMEQEQKNGCTFAHYQCEPEEYFRRLKEKLAEEVTEFLEDQTVEELGDILEVLYALASYKGYTPKQLDEVAENKRNKFGAFEQRLVLKEVRHTNDCPRNKRN